MPMTKLLDQATEKIRKLSDSERDEAAVLLLSVAVKRGQSVRLDEETREAVRGGAGQARRGEFVSDEAMAAFFKRHGA